MTPRKTHSKPLWHPTDEKNAEYFRRSHFGDDCCRALDAALAPRDEPNLVVPLLLSLQHGGMK